MVEQPGLVKIEYGKKKNVCCQRNQQVGPEVIERESRHDLNGRCQRFLTLIEGAAKIYPFSLREGVAKGFIPSPFEGEGQDEGD